MFNVKSRIVTIKNLQNWKDVLSINMCDRTIFDRLVNKKIYNKNKSNEEMIEEFLNSLIEDIALEIELTDVDKKEFYDFLKKEFSLLIIDVINYMKKENSI